MCKQIVTHLNKTKLIIFGTAETDQVAMLEFTIMTSYVIHGNISLNKENSPSIGKYVTFRSEL